MTDAVGVKHRPKNIGSDPHMVIKLGFGDYFGADMTERLPDGIAA